MSVQEPSNSIATQERISKIICCYGMLESAHDKSSLKEHVLTGTKIPSEVQEIFSKDKVAELTGRWGDPEWGSPIQYQHAAVTLIDGRLIEFEVFNLAIMLFSTEDERVKRIFRFMGRLERAIKKKD